MIEINSLVEEPLKVINSKINSTDNRVIVIGGGKGIGKSTILNNRNYNNITNGVSSIYTRFDASNTIGYLDKEFHEHYVELMMTNKLLNYILLNGKPTPVTFAIEREKSKYFKDLNTYMNNSFYNEELDIVSSNRNLLDIGDFTEELIYLINKYEGSKKLELLIDRFDHAEGSSESFQRCMEKYFAYFDKVILTTDDENYQSQYPIITIDYSKDMHIVSSILSKVVMGSNSINSLSWLDFLNNQTIQKLISRSNGNLKVLINTLNYLIENIQINELNTSYVLNEFINNIDKYNESQEKIKKMDACPPKFYI